jgi:hypothetical protein
MIVKLKPVGRDGVAAAGAVYRFNGFVVAADVGDVTELGVVGTVGAATEVTGDVTSFLDSSSS